MALSFFSAKNAKVRITSVGAGAAVVVPGSKWSLDFGGDKLDVTTFEAGGYYAFITGLLKADFTIDMPWDAAVGNAAGGNPLDAAGAYLIPGTTSTVLTLYLNFGVGANPRWILSNVVIEKVSNPMDVKADAKLTVTGSATGAFSVPLLNAV